MEDEIKQQIADGYIDSIGTPLKCIMCECTDLKDEIVDYSEHGVMEYKKVCVECGIVTGYWSYGNWQV